MRWIRSAVLLLLGGLMLPAESAHAQVGIRPGDERLEPPGFESEVAPSEPLELPPVPELPADDRGALSAGLRVMVREFRIEGGSVFSDEELASLSESYTGRELRLEELLAVRDRITQHYVERGYVTSGAVIPDQDVEDGVVRVRVVEGVLSGVDVEGVRHFRPGYFRDRLMRAGGAPVNVLRIEEQLQRFQRDPLVKRIQARLAPGEVRGESRLAVVVEEERPYHLSGDFSNHETPSIGELVGELDGGVANLIGYGDTLDAGFAVGESLRDYDVRFELPFTTWDTRFGVNFRYTESKVVEDPFDFLDIENEVLTAGVSLRQPLYRSEGQLLAAGITGEWRAVRSEATAFLLGTFCFDEGTGKCRNKVAVLRPYLEWTWRTRHDVIAARSQVSVGIDALGSTVVGNSSVPDSEFVSWLMQAQWAHRLPEWLLATEILAQFDSQLSNRPLLSIEKFAVGGSTTVRGYRENEIVSDNGMVASLELRVPVWRTSLGRPLVQLAPFFDWGGGWNDDDDAFERELMSVGIGLRVAPFEWLRGEVYWGHRLKSVPNPHDAIQDEGLSFRITIIAF